MLTVVDFTELETHADLPCFRQKGEGDLYSKMGLSIPGLRTWLFEC